VLTPPERPSQEDDGFLAASEIAALDLNADWVVLSACNTAAADGTPGAEGLSGLARAFFYAGARALLVSHWSVHSAAAVALTTAAFGSLREDPSIGRAEALRRSMVQLIDHGPDPSPAYWAPFVIVGEASG
jgi:CHAT domain-containing protein